MRSNTSVKEEHKRSTRRAKEGPEEEIEENWEGWRHCLCVRARECNACRQKANKRERRMQ